MPIDFKILTLGGAEELHEDGFAIVADGDRKIVHIEIDE